MKKTAKIQGKIKEIQKKYKGNQEKINQEMMETYKKENMSPFSGCSSAIIQLVLLLAMFYLVRSPLTYMKKIDTAEITKMSQQIVKQEKNQLSTSYPEVSIVKYVNDNNLKDSKFYINMNFLGLDLSNIPKENWQNWTVYIIPVLYIISSMASMSMMNKINSVKKEKDIINKEDIIITENKQIEKEANEDMASQMNKNMMWLMPIMSVSISLIAPLGLAMYWLINNILMIIEKLILNKVLEPKEEKPNE